MVARGAALPQYGGSTLDIGDNDDDEMVAPERPTGMQILTIAMMLVLITAVVVMSLLGMTPDIGVLGYGLGAVAALLDASAGKKAMSRIDWGSVLLVGGIITYVGVLTEMGVVDMLGEGAVHLGSPLVAAVLLCAAAGLISAFASTTGMLAALVPWHFR